MKQFLYLLVLFLLFCGTLTAQQREIKGVVSDENGNALIGANVVVLGTTNGTTTDANGNFSLTLNGNDDSLKVSYLGFQDKAVAISNKNFLNIVLSTKAVGLNEVVAIGYGTQRKVDLTGAVSSIGGKEIAKMPVMRASAALEGLASGVTVRQTSGQPGEDQGDIKIRGIGTLGNSNPLILIDGVQGNLDGIDPNDIANISILKDAAAAAIYGSRAANGVILITTKKGRSGKPKLNYNAYFGWQRFTSLPKFADGYTYMKALNQAYINEGRDPLYSDSYLEKYKTNYKTDPDNYPNTNWQNEVYTGSGFLQFHSLSVSGGSKFINVRGSLAYQDQLGQIPHYESQRYSFRVNTEMHITDNLQLELDLTGRHSPTFAPQQGASVIVSETERIPPVFPAKLTNGKYGVGWSGTNPLAIVREGGIFQHNFENFRGTLQVNYQPFKGVDMELNYTPTYGDEWGKGFTKSIDTYNPDSDVPAYTKPAESKLSESDTRNRENTFQFLLKYSKSIKKNNIHFLVGYEQIGYEENILRASRYGFPLPEYQQLNAGSINDWSNAGTASSWALRSEFGRLNYNFDGKYLFQANLRRDGSSRFATGHKYGIFPSFSAGWRISEENFMRGINWLSNLKIRASWGELGNQLIGTYPFSSTINLGVNYIFGGTSANGAAQIAMANSEISWESTATKDIGVDAGLFDNKFNLTFDYYIKNTTGILLELPIPGDIGLSAPYQNAGAVKNTGWDLSVNYRNQLGLLKYSLGLHLSDVKNEVMDLKGTGPYISSYSIIEEGYPINELYGYKALGLFKDQAEVNKHAKQFGTYGPGDIIYKDINKDGTINSDDRVELGSQLPRYTFGLSFSAEYHNFDLSFLIQGVGKRSIFLYKNTVWAFYSAGKIQTWQLDYWTPDNLNAKYPRLVAETTHNNFENSSFWVYNAAYARLKNLQIGYSLPKAIFSHTFIDHLRFYVSGEDIFTLDHMPSGWDPERNSGGATTYPISSTYIFGLNLTF